MNIFISGLHGILGRNLRHLLSDHNVVPLDLRNSNLKDIRRLITLHPHPRILLHLAWPVRAIEYQNSLDNLLMLELSKSIFQECQNEVDLIVGIGTVMEAGESGVVGDTIQPKPNSRYAECKYLLSRFLLDKVSTPSLWLRISYQISAFDPTHKLVPKLLNDKSGMNIRQPSNSYDFIHVSDSAMAIKTILSNHLFMNTKSEMVIGVGRMIQISELAQAFGVSLSQIANGGFMSLCSDPKKLQSMGWRAFGTSASDLYDLCIKEMYPSDVDSTRREIR